MVFRTSGKGSALLADRASDIVVSRMNGPWISSSRNELRSLERFSIPVPRAVPPPCSRSWEFVQVLQCRARARASLSHSLCMKHYKTLSRRNNIAHRCANLLGLRLRQSGESPYSVPHGFCAKLVLFDESNNKSRETSGTLSRAATRSLFKYNSAQVSTKCAICGSIE